MIYETLTIIILVLGLLSLQKYNSKFKKLFVTVAGIAFTVFMGFRSFLVGTDTPGYVESFQNTPKISLSFILDAFAEKEAFYKVLQSLVRTVTDNYTVFFTVIAVFCICSVCRFIYKYSSNPTMSFIAYMSMAYYAFNLAGIRQTIALAILLFAMDSMIEKKTVRALMLIGIASLFHISSLIGVFIILIYYLPLNGIYVAICCAFSAFMYVSGNSFWKKVVDLVWEDTRGYKEDSGGTSTLILLILISVGIAFIAPHIFAGKRTFASYSAEEQDKITVNAYFYRLLLFSIPFQVLAIYQANAFRVAMIFHIVLLALLPNSVTFVKGDKERILINLGLIGCLLIQLFVFTYWAADINPYTFFWQV